MTRGRHEPPDTRNYGGKHERGGCGLFMVALVAALAFAVVMLLGGCSTPAEETEHGRACVAAGHVIKSHEETGMASAGTNVASWSSTTYWCQDSDLRITDIWW